MEEKTYTPRACDVEFFERELESFVPSRVYDTHAHFHHPDFWPSSLSTAPAVAGYEEYQECIHWLLPRRKVAAMFLAYADAAEKTAQANEWSAAQITKDPMCRGEYFAGPQDDPEFVRQEVKRLKLHGLKVYHALATTTPTWDANIPDYFPEPLAKVAHEEQWVVTLHMVKDRAVADPENLHWIRHYCRTCPGMKLILAHSARGFQPAHNLEGLAELQGLENLYFDMSANSEVMAHLAILRYFGPQKLLYGSDAILAGCARGRCVAVADSFLWLHDTMPIWDSAKHQNLSPVLVGLEDLRSLKWACWAAKLKDSDIEDIFWNNAATLLQL
jgi:glutamate-1-semialdehyde 2,1-aminomutase